MKISPFFNTARKCFPRLLLAVWISVIGGATTGVASALEMQSVETGKQVQLEDITGDGKWTLVMIWASTCHICRLQKPEMSAFHDKHKDSKAKIIGLALDGAQGLDAVNRYIEETKPSFPSYVADGIVIASYYYSVTEESLRGTPTYLLYNPEGELMANNPGMLSVEALESFIEKNS